MGAIEQMRILEMKSGQSSRAGKEKQREDLEEWDGEAHADWEVSGFPPVIVGGLGSGGKKKASSLRNEKFY